MEHGLSARLAHQVSDGCDRSIIPQPAAHRDVVVRKPELPHVTRYLRDRESARPRFILRAEIDEHPMIVAEELAQRGERDIPGHHDPLAEAVNE
jgi:hypothetical protein